MKKTFFYPNSARTKKFTVVSTNMASFHVVVNQGYCYGDSSRKLSVDEKRNHYLRKVPCKGNLLIAKRNGVNGV